MNTETMEANRTLPDDVAEEILCMLPVRQLLRLRCVSKSWCAMIDNPRFINKQHNKQCAILKEEGDIPMLLCKSIGPSEDSVGQFYCLSKRYGDVPFCVTPDLRRDMAPHPSRNSELLNPLCITGCANGVVLLQWGLSYLGLWNPATREFKVVPPCWPRLCRDYNFRLFTLGFDPKCNDFKIIWPLSRISDDDKDSLYRYEMYSLNTNSWKSIEHPCPGRDILINFFGGDVYINSIHYWPCMDEHNRSNLILSFDFCNEMFKVLNPPRKEGVYRLFLGEYFGSLAVICNTWIHGNYSDEGIQHLEIWVMTEVDDSGISSSWKHLFRVGPFLGSRWVCFHSFRMDGDMLIRVHPDGYVDGYGSDDDGTDKHEIALYDPGTNKFTKRFGFAWGPSFKYVESLFQLSKREFNF